eukprot:6178636-Pleurochrysis_carterae.AAC.3
MDKHAVRRSQKRAKEASALAVARPRLRGDAAHHGRDRVHLRRAPTAKLEHQIVGDGAAPVAQIELLGHLHTRAACVWSVSTMRVERRWQGISDDLSPRAEGRL